MEEIGIPELTQEQLEKLCEIGEKAARQYVLSKVSSSKILTLNISIDADKTKPVTVNIDVEVGLSPLMKDCNVEKLVKEAIEKAFASIKEYLSELTCRSTK